MHGRFHLHLKEGLGVQMVFLSQSPCRQPHSVMHERLKLQPRLHGARLQKPTVAMSAKGSYRQQVDPTQEVTEATVKKDIRAGLPRPVSTHISYHMLQMPHLKLQEFNFCQTGYCSLIPFFLVLLNIVLLYIGDM